MIAIKHYLCLDYGEKHIGVAIAKTFLADPYQTIPTDQATLLLGNLIKQHQITHIVLGSTALFTTKL